ncbi:MAG: FAD-dependent oxidoreductase, partial [Betaproteobacteria bacterium]|nr:FAD-dependent oxidoreductase [Betaproteobacteria bacterium]
SPFAAPATLMLIAHVEQQGVWAVAGGMHQIARTLADAAQRHGAELRTQSAVREVMVRAGCAVGVRLGSGEVIDARCVVFNGDTQALASGLLGHAASSAVPGYAAKERSLSAVTWNLLAHTQGFPLSRHNVFFSPDYAAEFAQLFGQRRLPTQPTVYICAMDRIDDSGATGPERLMCLVNAPACADEGGPSESEVLRCKHDTLAALQRCGLRWTCEPGMSLTTTPADFAQRYPGTGGALYGRATHGWRAAFRRPGARTAITGLYLAGGSVHPGAGVPMAALSGRLATRSVLEDRASTRPLHPVATAGGTSTPSTTRAPEG